MSPGVPADLVLERSTGRHELAVDGADQVERCEASGIVTTKGDQEHRHDANAGEVSPTRPRASSVAWTLISSASPTSVQQTTRSRSVALPPHPARLTSLLGSWLARYPVERRG